jgi:hypothetical protein
VKITNIGVIVATRELELAGKPPVSVVVGKPERFPDGSGFYCPFQITGLGDDSIKYGGGEDAVQALMLTLKRIGALLYTSSEAKSGLLTWDCATTVGDLGFPVPESISGKA